MRIYQSNHLKNIFFKSVQFAGKIILNLNDVPNAHALPLINQLNWRIFQIDLDAKFLADVNQTPKMNLDMLLIKRVESFGKFF